jgi:hypothetical protein
MTAQAKYRRSPRGQMARRNYARSHRGRGIARVAGRKWRRSARGRAWLQAYRRSSIGRKAVRNSTLKHDFGITLQEREVMQRAQNDRCAICEKKFVKTPCVDHDHKTGKVRGLLCHKCNRGIGFLGDDLGVVMSAARYLSK